MPDFAMSMYYVRDPKFFRSAVKLSTIWFPAYFSTFLNFSKTKVQAFKKRSYLCTLVISSDTGDKVLFCLGLFTTGLSSDDL